MLGFFYLEIMNTGMTWNYSQKDSAGAWPFPAWSRIGRAPAEYEDVTSGYIVTPDEGAQRGTGA